MSNKDEVSEILAREKTIGGEIDDSIFKGQLDLMQEVEEVDDSLFPEDLIREFTTEKVISVEEKKGLYAQIKDLKVAGKIKLALMGNKEARDILLREQNKMVLRAVMKNPRMQINEVMKLAQSRNISDEVLRIISNNREWMRTYSVKKDLVFNPRTPLPVAIKLFRGLRFVDIKTLAKHKDASSTIQKMAKRHVDEMEKKNARKKAGGH